MERNENLQPFSWEHHDGLVIAQKLKKCPEEEDSPEVEELRTYFLKHWEDHLREHFRKEEDYLLPVIEVEYTNHPKSIRLVKEHIKIKSLVYKLENELEPYPGLLREIGNTLNDHIRFEEREFFPEAEKLLDEAQLTHLGSILNQEYKKVDKS